MADSRAIPAWRQRACFALVAAFTATLLLFATLLMFSRFMLYDDEGYVLITLRNFVEHGRLYRDVYTQYGPLPYVFYYALNLVGVPLTHTAGRIATLAIWTTTVLLSGWIVWRLTRRHALVVVTIAGVFTYLWVMANEPPHPGGLITLITAALAALGGYWLSVGKDRAWAVLAGAGATALMLTKINVGVFAAASAGVFLVLNLRHEGVRRWAPWAMGAAFALLPFALMRQLLHAEWIQTYAMVFSLSAAATVGAAAAGRRPSFGGREIAAAFAGAAGVCLVVVLVMLARHTTPADLLQGVLLGPLRHPVSFSMAFKWAPGTRAVAVISAVLFVVALLLRRQGRNDAASMLVALLRLAVAGGLITALAQFPAVSADNFVLAYGLSCVWLFAWPLVEDSRAAAACSWIALLQLGQFLHPFPVPGSQIAWGTFLSLPAVAIGAWQAGAWLAPRLPALHPHARVWLLTVATGLVALATFLTVQFGRIGNQYLDGRNLALAGAEPVRLPDESTARYQVLCFNALAHSDMLFSEPGMFSFNLWTGLPTPTYANVTHWFSLLTTPQQQEIIRTLEGHPRAVVIVEARHVDFLRRNHLAPAGVLHDYIDANFVPVFSIDHFEFRVRKGRRIAPFFMAEVFKRPPETNGGATRDSENTRLVIPLSLPADQAIGSIEVLSRAGLAPPLILRGNTVRAEVTPITPQGDARGPGETRTLPLTLRGAASVAFMFDGKDRPFGLTDTLIVLRNPEGAELGLVRLRP